MSVPTSHCVHARRGVQYLWLHSRSLKNSPLGSQLRSCEFHTWSTLVGRWRRPALQLQVPGVCVPGSLDQGMSAEGSATCSTYGNLVSPCMDTIRCHHLSAACTRSVHKQAPSYLTLCYRCTHCDSLHLLDNVQRSFLCVGVMLDARQLTARSRPSIGPLVRPSLAMVDILASPPVCRGREKVRHIAMERLADSDASRVGVRPMQSVCHHGVPLAVPA